VIHPHPPAAPNIDKFPNRHDAKTPVAPNRLGGGMATIELWQVAADLIDAQTENPVVPFAPTDKGTSSNGDDRLDKAGQSILHLLHKAAGLAEKNSQHALDMTQKLSHQLRVAEQRITDLEAEVERHRSRAERAEQWLHKVYTEIKDRFLRQESGRAQTGAR
jgi:hypothetical protein